ncbi:MAG TPA: hypothetical protein GX731_02630 [Clostridiales bacterium]|nr:hypothetical protein [Clostridiales bacterium]
MDVNSVTNQQIYKSNNYNTKPADVNPKNVESSEEAASAAVYEPSSQESKKATYEINKMSDKDRAALVQQLKIEQAARQQQFISLVKDMMSKQGVKYAQASDTDIWKFLASGDYTVDPETKAQALRDIAEDGYYGVKQTSQRIFDFASALAGDDVEKMKEMEAAFQRGFKLATGDWGKELPDISKDTYKAVSKLFDDYYKSKKADSKDAN